LLIFVGSLTIDFHNIKELISSKVNTIRYCTSPSSESTAFQRPIYDVATVSIEFERPKAAHYRFADLVVLLLHTKPDDHTQSDRFLWFKQALEHNFCHISLHGE